MSLDQNYGMGWQRDLPDIRDYTAKTTTINSVLSRSSAYQTNAKSLPAKVDLSQWCSPIENQYSIGSCTANAAVGLIEYFEQRAFGKHLDASRLFLYKVTRNLLGWTGDTGAYMRTVMKAMVLFGVPPTKYYPYEIAVFDEEPPAFCYAFAQNYKAIQYYRIDPPGTPPSTILETVKVLLAGGLPSMFGFTVYSSISSAGGTGEIPFPGPGESVEGGHAVVAIGYDDEKKIGNETGAFKIRNSWGTGWGDNGYGWLPYEYVLHGLAVDWWSLIKSDYVDTDLFKE